MDFFAAIAPHYVFRPSSRAVPSPTGANVCLKGFIMTSSTLLTCPHCGYQSLEALADDDQFYECDDCHALLTPKPGHDSVFASYGDSAPMPLDPLPGELAGGLGDERTWEHRA